MNTEADLKIPSGFHFSSLQSGIHGDRLDTAIIYADSPCRWSGVFTKNRVKAHCVQRNSHLLDNGKPVRAIIANSGNANACTGSIGSEKNREMAHASSKVLDCDEEEVLTASTGVIGVQLPIEKIREGLKTLPPPEASAEAALSAAKAIMTTDTRVKAVSRTFSIADGEYTICGIAKGSGMIHPNMGTMLSFLCTDAPVSKSLLNSSLKTVVDETFNMISVDGDTSTNDMVLLLSSAVHQECCDIAAFREALYEVCEALAIAIASDGEGASKLIECNVQGASSIKNARLLAKSVIGSNLVKCAFFGEDANWGRVLAAMGYSGADFASDGVKITFTNADHSKSLNMMANGSPQAFSEELASSILGESSIIIHIDLQDGSSSAKAWGCDLSYDYVKINGDYRT